MFTTVVTIKGLLKFLNSHLVGGIAIACKLERKLGIGRRTELGHRYLRETLRDCLRVHR